MAVNWTDLNQVKAFRTEMLRNPNQDPTELDNYISQKVQENRPIQQPIQQPTPPVTTQVEPAKENWIKSAAKNVWDVGTGGIGIALEAGHQALNVLNPHLKEISKKIDKGTATEAEIKEFIEAYNAKFIKQKEMEQISGGENQFDYTKPFSDESKKSFGSAVGKGALLGAKKGVGTAATIGSVFAPGATTLAGATTTAGLVGAGTGFAQPQDELSLSGSVGQAFIGGVMGAVLGNLLGRLRGLPKNEAEKLAVDAVARKNWLQKFGGDVEDSVRGLKQYGVEKNPYFAKNLHSLQNVATKHAGVGSAETQLTNINNSFNKINGVISEKLSEGGGTSLTKSQLSKLINDAVDEKTVAQNIIDKIWRNKAGSRVTALDMFNSKNEFGNQISRLFDASSLSDPQLAQVNAYRVLKQGVDKLSGNKISALTEEQSALHEISFALAKMIDKSPIKLGAITPTIPGLNRPLQSLTSRTGSIIRKTGDVLSGAGEPVLTGPIGDVIQRATPVAAGIVGGKTSSGIDSSGKPSLDLEQQRQQELQAMETEQEQGIQDANSIELYGKTYTRDDIWNKMLSTADTNEKAIYQTILNEIDRKYEVLKEERKTGELSATDIERRSVNYSIQSAYESLLSNPNIKTGLLAGPWENIKAKVNIGDPDTLNFNATMSALRGSIVKARAGTSFTKTEQALLDQYVPKTGDSRQEMLVKLNALIRQKVGQGSIPSINTTNVPSLKFMGQ